MKFAIMLTFFVNYVSLILILLLFLGEVTSGKHTNKYTKGAKKSHRETRNDSIARKLF